MDHGKCDVGGWRHGFVVVVCICRRRSFQRLHPEGQILTPRGAAHNYYVEVSLSGAMNETTGMLLNIRDIDLWVDQALERVPTEPLSVERLATVLFEAIQKQVIEHDVELKKLRLFESPDYWVDIWP